MSPFLVMSHFISFFFFFQFAEAAEAKKKLVASGKEGDYLLRKSSGRVGQLSLSLLVTGGEVKHFHVQDENGQVWVKTSAKFDSVPDMLLHYMQPGATGLGVRLRQPLLRPPGRLQLATSSLPVPAERRHSLSMAAPLAKRRAPRPPSDTLMAPAERRDRAVSLPPQMPNDDDDYEDADLPLPPPPVATTTTTTRSPQSSTTSWSTSALPPMVAVQERSYELPPPSDWAEPQAAPAVRVVPSSTYVSYDLPPALAQELDQLVPQPDRDLVAIAQANHYGDGLPAHLLANDQVAHAVQLEGERLALACSQSHHVTPCPAPQFSLDQLAKASDNFSRMLDRGCSQVYAGKIAHTNVAIKMIPLSASPAMASAQFHNEVGGRNQLSGDINSNTPTLFFPPGEHPDPVPASESGAAARRL
jgi:hypothetical protein